MKSFKQFITEARPYPGGGKMNTHETLAHNDANDFLNTVHKHLTSKGYKHENIKSSAAEENRYTKGDREISINGWHGKGKYGSGRSVHSLFDTASKPAGWHGSGAVRAGGYHAQTPVHETPIESMTDGTNRISAPDHVVAHKAGLDKMMKHIIKKA